MAIEQHLLVNTMHSYFLQCEELANRRARDKSKNPIHIENNILRQASIFLLNIN